MQDSNELMELLELTVSVATGSSDARGRIALAITEGFDDAQFTIADVALAVGLSERRVRDILAAANTSFKGEVMKRRMIKARALLCDPRNTISQVAFLCGYRCPSTFAARFREANGMTPRAWRESEGVSVRASRTRRASRGGAPRRATRGERKMLEHARRHDERRAQLRDVRQQHPQSKASGASAGQSR